MPDDPTPRKKKKKKKRRRRRRGPASSTAPRVATAAETAPDYSKRCLVCGATPVLPVTGMCGPHTFGEADTAGGDW